MPRGSELIMSVFIFNNIETGQVWQVQGVETLDEAITHLPEDADWEDWFELKE